MVADVRDFFLAGPPPGEPSLMSKKMESIDSKNAELYKGISEDYGRKEGSGTVPVLTIMLPKVGPTPLNAHDQLVLLGLKKGKATISLREMMVQTTKKNLMLARTLSDSHNAAAEASPDNDGFEESNQTLSNMALSCIDEDSNAQFPEVHVDESSNGSAAVAEERRPEQAMAILDIFDAPDQ
jgi:hypothetical protein